MAGQDLWDACFDTDPQPALDLLKTMQKDAIAVAASYRKGASSATPLHNACLRKHTTALTLMMNAGADVNVVSVFGETPLHDAARKNWLFGIERLLAAGADLEWPNQHGYTPLHWAGYHGHQAAVDVLMAKGADPHSRNERHWTVMHTACWFGLVDIVETMLSWGADHNLKTIQDRTVLQIAVDQSCRGSLENRLEIIRALRRYGADPLSPELSVRDCRWLYDSLNQYGC